MLIYKVNRALSANQATDGELGENVRDFPASNGRRLLVEQVGVRKPNLLLARLRRSPVGRSGGGRQETCSAYCAPIACTKPHRGVASD